MDYEIPVQEDSHASSSHEVSLEPTFKRREDLGKHSIFFISLKTEIARSVKGPKLPGPRAEDAMAKPYLALKNIWWHDNSRSQGSQWKLRISKQSPVCSRGAGLSHSMDPGVSVQKQNFTRNPEKLAKVPGTREETKSHLHWQFLGIWQSLWRSFLETLCVDTTQIGNKWDCWKSSAQSERRHLCSNVAARSGWKLVGRFYGMLHLSAKRHRSTIWWEDALWKTFWATI